MTTHTTHDLLNAALRTDFQAFSERAFMTLNPTETFRDNWALQVIAHHLNFCASRKIRRLLILVPPRSLKSIMASIVSLPKTLSNLTRGHRRNQSKIAE